MLGAFLSPKNLKKKCASLLQFVAPNIFDHFQFSRIFTFPLFVSMLRCQDFLEDYYNVCFLHCLLLMFKSLNSKVYISNIILFFTFFILHEK